MHGTHLELAFSICSSKRIVVQHSRTTDTFDSMCSFRVPLAKPPNTIVSPQLTVAAHVSACLVAFLAKACLLVHALPPLHPVNLPSYLGRQNVTSNGSNCKVQITREVHTGRFNIKLHIPRSPHLAAYRRNAYITH